MYVFNTLGLLEIIFTLLVVFFGLHDIQHNDTQHNDIQRNDLSIMGLFATLSIMTLGINDTQHHNITALC
jgi:hypothetical protein